MHDAESRSTERAQVELLLSHPEIIALVSSDNPAALAVLRRIADTLDIRRDGAELSIRAAIA